MLESGLKARLSSLTGEDFGEWDAFEGGEWDHDEQKYTPFDGVERTYLSHQTTSNVTVTRLYEEARDGLLVSRKDAISGVAVKVVIVEKDVNGIWQQNRPPYTGLWKKLTPPNGKSDQPGVAMIAAEISTGTAGA